MALEQFFNSAWCELLLSVVLVGFLIGLGLALAAWCCGIGVTLLRRMIGV